MLEVIVALLAGVLVAMALAISLPVRRTFDSLARTMPTRFPSDGARAADS